MNRRVAAVLESLVAAVVLLALGHAFLDDYSVLAGWEQPLRGRLLLAGFFLDLFFTIEFLVRLFYAAAARRLGRYLGLERGWLDFLASVPLLLFCSGPVAVDALPGPAAVLGISQVLSVPRLIQAGRITRPLRLLRIVKLFRPRESGPSPLARLGRLGGPEADKASAVSVTVLSFCLLAFRLCAGLLGVGGPETAAVEREQRLAAHLAALADSRPQFVQALGTLAATDPGLLVVRHGGTAVYSRFDDAHYGRFFAPGDYAYLQRGGLELFCDRRPRNRVLAGESLLFLAAALLIVLAHLLARRPAAAGDG